MGRYGGMVTEILRIVKAMEESGELDRILNHAKTSPVPTWRDVTDELDEALFPEGGHINKNGKHFIACPIGYRLRKVQLARPKADARGYPTNTNEYDTAWAFIVERREP